MKAFFEISELSCSYGEKIVLRIDELTIPKGEMVFIVGQSGCGKSTILEALGLMNDTIVKNEKTVFNNLLFLRMKIFVQSCFIVSTGKTQKLLIKPAVRRYHIHGFSMTVAEHCIGFSIVPEVH